MHTECWWRTAGVWYKRGSFHHIRKSIKRLDARFYLVDWILRKKGNGSWNIIKLIIYYYSHTAWWLCSYNIKPVYECELSIQDRDLWLSLPFSHWISLFSPLPFLVRRAETHPKSAFFYQPCAMDPPQGTIFTFPWQHLLQFQVSRWFVGIAFIRLSFQASNFFFKSLAVVASRW